jgi:hypothetical protein
MKILVLNGSPKGNKFTVLSVNLKAFIIFSQTDELHKILSTRKKEK